MQVNSSDNPKNTEILKRKYLGKSGNDIYVSISIYGSDNPLAGTASGMASDSVRSRVEISEQQDIFIIKTENKRQSRGGGVCFE